MILWTVLLDNDSSSAKSVCVIQGFCSRHDNNLPSMHIAKLNGRLCGAKRPHSVSEQPNFYQSLQSNPYNDSSHPSGGE